MIDQVQSQRVSIRPSAKFCFGRRQLAKAVIASAIDCQSVLLYGGRQAGKTTVLRFIENILDESIIADGPAADYTLGIYVNLLALPFDATPEDFYSFMIERTLSKCRKLVRNFEASVVLDHYTRNSSVDEFQNVLSEILYAFSGRLDGFIFLLDESKRILGRRFARGFQDNLFSLLYGTELGCRQSIVFSGAQDLHILLEDDTSPIGSRAATHVVRNLKKDAIKHMLNEIGTGNSDLTLDRVSRSIYHYTGGHAGTSARFVERWANTKSLNSKDVDVSAIYRELMPRLSSLFQHWSRNFTSGANVVLDELQARNSVSLKEIAFWLEKNGISRFDSELVCQELQYSGVIVEENSDIFVRSNSAYWSYRSRFQPDNVVNLRTKKIWDTIEEVESTLRVFVKMKYEMEWPHSAYNEMERNLGLEAWNKLESLKEKANSYYPLLRHRKEREIMECMYFGQLIDLMLNNSTWRLFKSTFKDKRQVQDIANAIIPVRNDRAHFVTVADKELERCGIVCDDLLVIVERELESATNTEMIST